MSHSKCILSFDLIWRTSKQNVLRQGNRLVAHVRRRYFSEGEKRRPEIRLRFAGYNRI